MGLIAWQGWRLTTPDGWDPIRLDGSWDRGSLMLADLHDKRLEMRWETPRKPARFDPARWAGTAMRDAVGAKVASDARDFDLPPPPPGPEGDVPGPDHTGWAVSRLFIDPEPPGRDVWVGYSRDSGRAAQIALHLRTGGQRKTAHDALRSLTDTPAADQPVAWSAFELSCVAPAGWKLASHRLMAGDLALTFANPPGVVTVRQVAVASLALTRLPLPRWLTTMRQARDKHFKPDGAPADIQLTALTGRPISGMTARMTRRRRCFYQRSLPRQLVMLAMHDEARDRLVLIESDSQDVAEAILASVGWAQGG